jgi:gliding motility-associated lipoprotein GldJ
VLKNYIYTMNIKLGKYFSLIILVLSLSACSKKSGGGDRDSATGWVYNDPNWGGFEKFNESQQVTGPNLVPIEGGTFSMGLTEQDVTFEWNNVPRRVTVSSFYMDESEVTNQNWKLYVEWLQKTYTSYPEVSVQALPDFNVWRDELAYNEPLVETYYKHPSYNDYPVVGVSWLQAQRYCEWRSDRVNEMLLIEKGILNPSPDAKDSESFNTSAYLEGQYQGNVKKNLPDLKTGGERGVRFEDGILLPSYMIPTEAQWEYAALALQGNQAVSGDELITDRRIYPWNGNTARYKKHNKNQGNILANFKRGKGDYMGMSGALNDNASIPATVRSFLPNDFGLYHMAGNVSEWTADVFRPMTSQELVDADNNDLNPYRGNYYTEVIRDKDGKAIEKDSLGRLKRKSLTDEELANRENYRKSNVKNYNDDDSEDVEYGYGKTSLISDKARVIKGGSWADRLFWLSPGARRFKDEDKSDRTIGFRCSMSRVGAEAFKSGKSGNVFREGSKKSAAKRRY